MEILGLTYLLVAILLFGYMCFNELKHFVRENKRMILIGIFASLFWPILLILVAGDSLEEYFSRKIAKQDSTPCNPT